MSSTSNGSVCSMRSRLCGAGNKMSASCRRTVSCRSRVGRGVASGLRAELVLLAGQELAPIQCLEWSGSSDDGGVRRAESESRRR